ncbi:MAG: cadherin-like beta sandwich domain-containing protein [Erysipelotrichales bacterium]|nr:cadherin-like beta sandwich domain-containing protein [Erysipelotrichales bacterium]
MKRINKLIILGVSVLICSLVSVNVNAAELTYSNSNKINENGVLKLPLIAKIGENETISEINLTCKVDDTDVSCTFQNADSNITSSGSDTNRIFKYVGEESGNFPSNTDTTIGYLVLTNSTETQKQVRFTITSTDNRFNIDSTSTTVSGIKIKSNDASLKRVTVSQGTMTPAFSTDITEYTIYNIPDTVKSVNIDTECTTSGCSVNIDSPAGKNGSRVNLNQGSNRIEVRVTSEDGTTTRVYALNILRGDTGYNSSKLTSLSFGDNTMSPEFKSDVLEYTVTIPNNITSLVTIMSYEKTDPNAAESLEGFDNLVVGENKATITLDSVNGDQTTTYIITIVRMNEQDIEVLKYKNNQITFRDSDGIQTTLSENEFKELYPEEWKKIENKEYKFDKDGNLITNEEEKEEEPKKKSNLWLIILIIVIGLIIIGVSGFFIFKRKKNPEENIDEENKDSEEEINEEGIEENVIKEEEKDFETETMNIDEALVDLMSTKQYEFKDEDE